MSTSPHPYAVPVAGWIGVLLALLVILLSVMFAAIGQLDPKVAALLAMLGLARLL